MATNLDSAQVAGGDDVLASQYNALRKDVIQNGGDYAASAGSSNAYTLAIDSAIAAYNEGQVFKFKANFANTGPATLNVNSIGAKNILKFGNKNLISGDIKSGDVVYVVYDGTSMLMLSSSSTDKSKFGGDGSDGALSVPSGTTNIDATSSVNIVKKNYTTINIASGATLALINPASDGSGLWLRATGNVDIVGTINVDYCGAIYGAAAVANTSEVNGNEGTQGFMQNVDGVTSLHKGGAGQASTGGSYKSTGGGGGAGKNAGSASSANSPVAAAPGGTVVEFTQTIDGINLTKKFIIFCGAGGGSGGATDNSGTSTSGRGGRGGGFVIIECAGSFNFTGTITAKGEAGQNGTVSSSGTENASGGGGGGGGFILGLYNDLTANSGTTVVTGGIGGTKAGGSGTNGGDGGDGQALIGKNESL